jgi:hypothetical protein
MALPYTGINSWIAFGEESTYGTAVTLTNALPLIDYSGDGRKVEKVPRPTLYQAGGGVHKANVEGSELVSFTATVELQYESFGLLLKHALGTLSTTGAGPYAHTYKMASTALLPTGLTVEVVRAGTRGEKFNGCKINKMTITFKPGDKVCRAQIEFIGRTADARTTAASSAPTLGAYPVLFFQGGDFTWNSGTYASIVQELTLVVDNKLARRPTVQSQYTLEPVAVDFKEVSLTVKMEYQADTLNIAYHASSESDAAITFTSGTRSILFTVHNSYIEDHDGVPIGGTGVLSETIKFRGQDDGTDYGIAIVVTNSQSSGIAA